MIEVLSHELISAGGRVLTTQLANRGTYNDLPTRCVCYVFTLDDTTRYNEKILVEERMGEIAPFLL